MAGERANRRWNALRIEAVETGRGGAANIAGTERRRVLSSRFLLQRAQLPSDIPLGCTTGVMPICLPSTRASRAKAIFALRLHRCGWKCRTLKAAPSSQAQPRWRRMVPSLCKLLPISQFALRCLMKRAQYCGRSTDGSGFVAENSATARAATRGRNARRRIACRPCCNAPQRPSILPA